MSKLSASEFRPIRIERQKEYVAVFAADGRIVFAEFPDRCRQDFADDEEMWQETERRARWRAGLPATDLDPELAREIQAWARESGYGVPVQPGRRLANEVPGIPLYWPELGTPRK